MFPPASFCCDRDVLLLQGKHNGFRHIVACKVIVLTGSEF